MPLAEEVESGAHAAGTKERAEIHGLPKDDDTPEDAVNFEAAPIAAGTGGGVAEGGETAGPAIGAASANAGSARDPYARAATAAIARG